MRLMVSHSPKRIEMGCRAGRLKRWSIDHCNGPLAWNGRGVFLKLAVS